MSKGMAVRVRVALWDGPATLDELAADSALQDLTRRDLNVAMWILTSQKQAIKCGLVPSERPHSKGNQLYRLTRKGRQMCETGRKSA